MRASNSRTVMALACLTYLAATRMPGTDLPSSLAPLAVVTFLIVAVLGPRFWSILGRLQPYGLLAIITLVLLPPSEKALIQPPWMATMAVVLLFLHALHKAPRRAVHRDRRPQTLRLLKVGVALAVISAAAALAHFLPNILPGQLAAVHEIRYLGASVLASLAVASVLVTFALVRELLSRPSVSNPPDEVSA